MEKYKVRFKGTVGIGQDNGPTLIFEAGNIYEISEEIYKLVKDECELIEKIELKKQETKSSKSSK